ncbi:hypothetical protein [Mixta mediterraneensis]|uniref:RipA family octameric membrane protein n=1 Tax=Mixta mediterraneensis TaxID=2758443 RepID=UPI001876A2BD|nr:hypothetical protein [Mixta mediterraneensis]MBE5254067.1 hypothetical protein [Mixta mediterraneensis]
MKEEYSIAFEHAWKYFELHSQQRMTVFNFYITVTTLLVAGGGACLQQSGKLVYLTSVFGFFISFMTLIFYKLDARVSFLIKNAELALKEIEACFDKPAVKIFTQDATSPHLNVNIFSMWSYGKCFRLAFYILTNVGFIFIISPLAVKAFQ